MTYPVHTLSTQRLFELSLQDEARDVSTRTASPASRAASWGEDVVKLMPVESISAEMVGLYARVAAHFGRKAMREGGNR